MRLRYIFYHAKAFFKKRESWVLLATIVLLILVFKDIEIPGIDNTFVGVVGNDSKRADIIIQSMEEGDSIYKIKRYDDAQALRDDVRSGKTECGFIFDDDFDQMVDRGRFKGSVTYICSPYTTKGLVAKETLFASFLKNYSNDVLLGNYKQMYASKDDSLKKEITDMLKEKNAYYIDSNAIFEVDFE